jgi:RNA polymerase sigma factor (sigma-70 family)
VLVTTHTSWRSRLSATETVVAALPDRADEAPSPGADEDLRAALRELPPRMRAAVVLRFFEDLTEQQTAAVMGCSPSTVNTQVARGLARLRATLGGPLMSRPGGTEAPA